MWPTLKNAPSAELGGNFGAGNVSIAILVCIGLGLASALYSGTTKAKDSNYHADENVKSLQYNFYIENLGNCYCWYGFLSIFLLMVYFKVSVTT